MRGALRILTKDLYELLEGRGVVLVFVLPVVLLLLVGQLKSQPVPFRILIAGESEEPVLEEVVDLLREVSMLEVSMRNEAVIDPLRVMNRDRFDLLLNIEQPSPDGWRIYTAEVESGRLEVLERLAAGLDRSIALIRTRVGEDEEQDQGAPVKAIEFAALGTVPLSDLFVYYPRAADRSVELVGRTMTLILCFLPFVLSAPSLIRERSAHTLELLLAAPGIGPGSLLAGKSLFVMVVTMFDFLLMVVVVQTVYSIHVKAGLLEVVSLLIPATLAAVLLGLTVSSLARTQTQALLVAAVYFLGMTLLGGLLYPLEGASATIQVLSKGFPLTYLRPAIHAWIVGAGPPGLASPAVGALWVQCAAFGAALWVAARWSRRHV